MKKWNKKATSRAPLQTAGINSHLSLNPMANNVSPLQLLHQAKVLIAKKNYPEALLLLEQAHAKSQFEIEIIVELGLCYANLKNWDAAFKLLQLGLNINHQHPFILHALSHVYHYGKQDSVLAIECCRKALEQLPNQQDFVNTLAQLYLQSQQEKEALPVLLKLLKLSPHHYLAHYNVGRVYIEKYQDFEKALPHLNKAYSGSTDPQLKSLALASMGEIYNQTGQSEKALEAYQQAHMLVPQDPERLSNYLYTIFGDPKADFDSIYHWHKRFGELYEDTLPFTYTHYPNSPISARKIKIGYVSADLKEHSALSIFIWLLEYYNPLDFDVFIYANNPIVDETSQRLYQLFGSHRWREIMALNDEQFAALVREDQIDILVDLSGHTAGSRLLAFARKPAPIQMSGLGWGSTTGLKAMDYRITDQYVVPAEHVCYNREHILYVSSVLHFIVTEQRQQEMVQPPPCLTNGYITFGYGNSPHKLNRPLITCWAKILKQIPHSCLHLKYGNLDHPLTIKYISDLFAQEGIAIDRLTFWGKTPAAQHRQFYTTVDIILDPFPYNGGISTLDMLWMGRPVVTLAGTNRVGISIMNVMGHPEWVAQTEEQYIEIATQLAKDHGKLAELALSIRPDMLNSHLCKTREFVLEMEQHYRQVWQDWCQQQSSSIAQLLQQAHVLYQQGQFSLAEDIYRDVLKQEPAQPDALQGLGLIAYEFGHFEPAVDLIQQAIVQQPTQASFYGNLGLIYTAMNHLERAIEAYEKSLVLDSNQPEIHERLGALWIKSGESAKALPHYVSLLPFASENPHLHNTLGNLYRETGDLGLAQSHYERTLTFDPGFVLAHFNLGQLYLQQHQTDKAKDCFKRALALQPDFEPAKRVFDTLDQ